LSARSTYWSRLFASGMREARERVVAVEGIGAVAMDCVLAYIYGDEAAASITGENVLEVLEAANRFQLDRLKGTNHTFRLRRLCRRCDECMYV
jgi:hypothetical protein